ncbi:SU10 major capsid protein [Paenibacillus dendritiformis]|uniref:SU10 major capsid protein n=1 Tax=Paenibacillus dendritiformis TaxID=130049 RepID=UPI00387E1B5D
MSKILSGELIGKRESVTDQLLLLNPYQTPFISMIGFSKPVSQVEHVWFEDSMFADESKVTAAAAADVTELIVADTEPFRSNQVVKVGEELILVTGVDKAAKKLAVMRGYADTTAADIEANAVIEVQFVEGVEGADAREGRFKPRVRKSNITQIFDETVDITGTAAAVANYGIDDLYEYEKAKKLLELALQTEKAFIGGIRYENGTVRQMDGVRNMIKTNVTDLKGEALTLEVINDSLQAIYTKGGFATGGQYEIVVPAKQKRVVGKFSENIVRIPNGDDKRGTVVNRLITDFGEFNVSINDNLSADELLILDKNRISIRALNGRDFFHEYLGKKGDYFQGQIVGEYTLEFHQEAAHARIKGAK